MSGHKVEAVVVRHDRFPLVDSVRAIAALTIFFVVSGFLIYRPFVAARFAAAGSPPAAP